jgi:hypothetical protein
MRIFKVIYEVINKREVWIETEDKSIDDNGIEELFLNNFGKYDDESDMYEDYGGDINVLTINEIIRMGMILNNILLEE